MRRQSAKATWHGSGMPTILCFSGNTLFRKDGGSVFQDVTSQVGPFPGGWAFGGVFVDIDNDGWEDLYAPNGFVSGETMKDT